MQRLAGPGDARERCDAAADGFHVGRSRSGFRAAKLGDELNVLALGLGHVLGVEITNLLLRGSWGQRERRGE